MYEHERPHASLSPLPNFKYEISPLVMIKELLLLLLLLPLLFRGKPAEQRERWAGGELPGAVCTGADYTVRYRHES